MCLRPVLRGDESLYVSLSACVSPCLVSMRCVTGSGRNILLHAMYRTGEGRIMYIFVFLVHLGFPLCVFSFVCDTSRKKAVFSFFLCALHDHRRFSASGGEYVMFVASTMRPPQGQHIWVRGLIGETHRSDWGSNRCQ